MSWAAVAVGVVAAGAGAASAATADSPNVYGPLEITRKNVNSLATYGLPTLALNRLYNPAFANIGNNVAEQTLFGTPQHVEKHNVAMYHPDHPHSIMYSKQKFNVPAQAGLLDLYERAGARLGDFNRQQTLADLNAMVPASVMASRMANPLLFDVASQAKQGLELGGALDPSTRRELEQASLQDSSLRGFGHSPLDAYNIYSNLGQASQQRLQQRQQFALQASQMMPDPFALMGRPAIGTTLGNAAGMQGAMIGRQNSRPAIDPFAFSGQSSTPADNTTSNILGAISGGLFNMAGGVASGRSPRVNATPGSTFNPSNGQTLYNAQF